MSLISRIGDRFKFAFSAQLVSAATGALLTVILARLLDPDSYGLFFLGISVLTIGKLISTWGIAKSASRFIAEYKEGDDGQIPHILRIAFVYNVVLISIVSLAFVVGGEQIAVFIGTPELGSMLVYGSLFIVFSTLTVFVTQAFQGFEEIKTASSFKILNKVGRLILVIAFLVAGFEVVGALAGYILSFAIVSVTGLIYLYYTKYRSIDSTPVETNLRRRIRNYSVPIAFTQSAHIIDHHIDKVLLGFFVGPAAVGFYTIGKQIVKMLQTPMSALGFTLSPTYGAQKAKGNDETARRIFETTLSQSLIFYIPATTGLILVAEPTVKLIFGNDYLGAVPVLRILSILIILQSITKLTSHGLDYLGRARARAIVKAVAAISNAFLNILLIPMYGVVGAAVATVVTFSFYTFANLWIMDSELNLKVTGLMKQVVYSVIITVPMSGVVLLLSQYITGFITLFSVISLGASVWLLLAVTLGLINVERAHTFLS